MGTGNGLLLVPLTVCHEARWAVCGTGFFSFMGPIQRRERSLNTMTAAAAAPRPRRRRTLRRSLGRICAGACSAAAGGTESAAPLSSPASDFSRLLSPAMASLSDPPERERRRRQLQSDLTAHSEKRNGDLRFRLKRSGAAPSSPRSSACGCCRNATGRGSSDRGSPSTAP